MEAKELEELGFKKVESYWTKPIDSQSYMQIYSDMSFCICSSVDDDFIVFENDIINNIVQLEIIWIALTGRGIGWTS